MSAALLTRNIDAPDPPARSASRITSPGKREKHHLAGDQTSHAINTRKGRYRQLDRFYRPLVAVWKALDWRDWEKLRQRCAERRSA
jgi:hypothetical protein